MKVCVDEGKENGERFFLFVPLWKESTHHHTIAIAISEYCVYLVYLYI